MTEVIKRKTVRVVRVLPTKDVAQQSATPKQMDFSGALLALKAGARVARGGWNGKGQFLYLVPGSDFHVSRPPLLGIYERGTPIKYHAHIDLRTVTGVCVPWNCTQTDMLADDWHIVSAQPLTPVVA